jgi:hypothetical protein
MTIIHEVSQVIICDTPFGECQVLFLMDYGIHNNTIWICASLEDGKIRHFDSNQISVSCNYTLEMNNNKKNKQTKPKKNK